MASSASRRSRSRMLSAPWRLNHTASKRLSASSLRRSSSCGSGTSRPRIAKRTSGLHFRSRSSFFRPAPRTPNCCVCPPRTPPVPAPRPVPARPPAGCPPRTPVPRPDCCT
ncbi:hypothetical protein DDD63_09880 [Actinobaculum sp. 313]|nr:hypothetical protein DDD63_09880 [Actinobaculum sp. 313]